jgi:hypothetical protein
MTLSPLPKSWRRADEKWVQELTPPGRAKHD